MGRLPLFILLLPLVFAGGPLTLEENEHIQKICGTKFAAPRPPPPASPQSRRFRSMNTPPATREEAPWAVAIRVLGRTGKETVHGHCTGSFISSRHVITAAHCIYHNDDCQPKPQPLPFFYNFALMTTTNCTQESCESTLKQKFVRVKKAFASRNYLECGGLEETWLGDVAVLELEEDVEFDDKVYPICLYDHIPTAGTELKMFGYGNTVDWPTTVGGGILRRLQAKIVSKQECKEYIKEKPDLKAQMDTICSRHPQGFACKGDSGSGQTIVKNGRAYLTGILSNGIVCQAHLTAKDIMDFSSGTQLHNRWIAAVSGVNTGYAMDAVEKAFLAKEYFEYTNDNL